MGCNFRHDELLSKENVYAGMWQQQLMKAEDSSTDDTEGHTSSAELSKPNGKKPSS